MRKFRLYLILLVVLCSATVLHAQSEAIMVQLYGDILLPSNQGKPKKAPSLCITIYQLEHMLQFDDYFENCTVLLKQDLDEDAVYSTTVNEDGIVFIPDIYMGDYYLVLILDDREYIGYINLS